MRYPSIARTDLRPAVVVLLALTAGAPDAPVADSRLQAARDPLVAGAQVAAGVNPIEIENAKPGTTDWLLTKVGGSVTGDPHEEGFPRLRAIEGYVSHTSIVPGDTLTAFVSVSPSTAYRVAVFRMGYYGGKGGRLMTTLGPLEGVTQAEPVEREQQLMETRWQPSFELPIPADWPSGVYLAKLTREDTGDQSYLIWVVRDTRTADLMFQVSDLTWQAYNRWPRWRSLYDWKDEPWHTAPGAKVSFDRPYAVYYNLLPVGFEPLSNGSGEFLLWEFPLAFWLEAHGYDVTYVSNIDTHADPEGLLRVKGFLSVGHDEYWTREMVANVSRARDRGVALAFLCGNAVDGEVTLEAGPGGPNRVFARYEGRGQDNNMSDEHLLMGSSSHGVGLGDWTVRVADHWLFEGTGLANGDSIPGLVGWEYHGPPLRDDATVVARGPVYNSRGHEQDTEFAATIYQGPDGTIVFNAGTCWWNMVLSSPPGFVNPNRRDFTGADHRVQRITQNLLARMIGRRAPALAGRAAVLDGDGRLLSWVQPQAKAFGEVVRLAWERLLTGFPVEENALPTWLTYCCFDGKTLRGTAWPHNPASVYAGLSEGAAAYYAYSGDRGVIDFMRRVLDYSLAHGTTPDDPAWAWRSVPYASADHGATRYRGAHDFRYVQKNDPPGLGRGDGYGVIEPDKVGELGFAYLTVWKLTDEARYRDAALACARALARHVRAGDAARSPWPFRVVAETGVVREEYSANLAFTLRLFDELTRLGLGEVDDWRRVRKTAWDWALAHPLGNDVWANYFEDLPWLPEPTNLNQYNAGEMARYILENPARDPDWRAHVGRILPWIERTFGGDTTRGEPGEQWGAVAISEQVHYMYKMGSHTARFASTLALWHEKTGDAAAREKAFRSFNWATYMCDERGVVRVGPTESSYWFSDGYGDYIRHFMVGLGAVPEWAPPGEDHLLRSSSVITRVEYRPGAVGYEAFDPEGEEVLRVSFAPQRVVAGGRALPQSEKGAGWSVDSDSGVLRVRRTAARQVTIEAGTATPPGR